MAKLSILFLLVACATPIERKDFSHLKPRDLELKDNYKTIKSLTNKQLQEDINYLRYALDQGYGGVVAIPKRKLGVVDAQLKNLQGPYPHSTFCHKIGKILLQIPDQHLKAKYKGQYCLQKKPSLETRGMNLNRGPIHWKGKIEKIKGQNIAVIGVKKFPHGSWKGFKEFLNKTQVETDLIVLDMRGNGGGNDIMGLTMAESLAGQKLNIPQGGDVKRQTPEAFALWINYLKTAKKNFKGKEVQKQLSDYLKKAKKDYKKALVGGLSEFKKSKESPKYDYNPRVGYQGKIYILMDKTCSSSCENVIDYFESMENVIRVGTATSGTIHFGNIGLIVLPHSGIQVNIPTKYNSYKDKRFIEFKGIQADIEVPQGEDAFDYLIKTQL